MKKKRELVSIVLCILMIVSVMISHSLGLGMARADESEEEVQTQYVEAEPSGETAEMNQVQEELIPETASYEAVPYTEEPQPAAEEAAVDFQVENETAPVAEFQAEFQDETSADENSDSESIPHENTETQPTAETSEQETQPAEEEFLEAGSEEQPVTEEPEEIRNEEVVLYRELYNEMGQLSAYVNVQIPAGAYRVRTEELSLNAEWVSAGSRGSAENLISKWIPAGFEIAGDLMIRAEILAAGENVYPEKPVLLNITPVGVKESDFEKVRPYRYDVNRNAIYLIDREQGSIDWLYNQENSEREYASVSFAGEEVHMVQILLKQNGYVGFFTYTETAEEEAESPAAEPAEEAENLSGTEQTEEGIENTEAAADSEEETGEESETDESEAEESEAEKSETEETESEDRETEESETENTESEGSAGEEIESEETEIEDTESGESGIEELESEEAESEDAETEEAEEGEEEQILFFENTVGNAVVTAMILDPGCIPAGASFHVEEVPAGSGQYYDVERLLEEKAAAEDYNIAGFLAYDIYFEDAQGNRIEPENGGRVEISIDYTEAVPTLASSEMTAAEFAEDISLEEAGIRILDENGQELEPEPEYASVEIESNVTVIHLEENESGEVAQVVDMAQTAELLHVETTAAQEVEAVSFVSDSFSIFVVANVVSSSGTAVTGTYKMLQGEEITVVSDKSAKKHNWTSGSSSVASVNVKDDSGNYSSAAVITAVGVGTTTITHKYDNNTEKINITVEDRNVRVRFWKNAKNEGKTDSQVISELTVERGIDGSCTVPLREANEAVQAFNTANEEFNGWSLDALANYKPKGYHYKGNSVVLDSSAVSNGVINLYATWGMVDYTNNSYSKEVGFYLRLDGTIPVEPTSYGKSEYTKGWNLGAGALYRYQHLYNDLSAVAANIKRQPGAAEIASQANEANSGKGIKYTKTDGSTEYVKLVAEGDSLYAANADGSANKSREFYVVWYVVKFDAQTGAISKSHWHVDGTIREKNKWNLSYDPNADGEEVKNIILGSQYAYGASATVYNTQDSSGALLEAEPIRYGYKFTQWNLAQDGTGVPVKLGDQITVNEADKHVYLNGVDTGVEAAVNAGGGYEAVLYAQWVFDNDIPEGSAFITVNKTFRGLSYSQIRSLHDFCITVTPQGSGSGTELRLNASNVQVSPAVVNVNEIRDYTFTWKVACGTGTYDVSESGESLDGFEISRTGFGDSVSVEGSSWSFDSSQVSTITTNSVLNFELGEHKMIAVSFTGNGITYMVWTYEELSVPQKQSVLTFISNTTTFQTGAATFDNTVFFYGPESLKDGITFKGGTVKFESGTLTFTNTNIWKHVLGGTYGWSNGRDADIEVSNAYSRKIKLVKVDEENGPVAGAVFSLFGAYQTEDSWTVNESEELLSRLTSDAQGVFYDGTIAPGVYYLEETAAPAGYEKLSDPRRIEVNASGVYVEGAAQSLEEGKYVIRVQNSRLCQASASKVWVGSVTQPCIYTALFEVKSDGTEQEVPETVRELKDENNWSVVYTDLKKPEVSYVVREMLQTEDGYQKAEEGSVQIGEQNYLVDYEDTVSAEGFYETLITNTLNTSRIEVVKVSASDHALKLAGAEFELTMKEDAEFKQTGISGADGVVIFSDLVNGTYYLKETKAPAGYTLSEETITIEVDFSSAQKETVDKVEYGMYQREVENAVVYSLPSTGGIGTTVFTVVGCVLMIGAVALFFASRRKNNHDDDEE